MRELRNWAKLPSTWIEKGGLKEFSWGQKGGSAQAAALMTLLAISHRTADETGSARRGYDELHWATHLSRTKIAHGLDVLEGRGLVVREVQGRSTFQLSGYDPKQGWAMVPVKKLYSADGMTAFSEFHLRKKVELDALKAYLAFAARRDRKQNRAHITYEQLNKYVGIPEARIKPAISMLVVNNLVVVEQIERSGGGLGVSHSYRLKNLFPNKHVGTVGRADMPLTGEFE